MGSEPKPLNIYDLTMVGIVCNRSGLLRYTTSAELTAKPDLFCLYFDEVSMLALYRSFVLRAFVSR